MILESKTNTQNFEKNKKHHLGLISELNEKLSKNRHGYDKDSIGKHKERGKLLARERVERLIDADSAFLELSPLAAHGIYDDQAPGAGIITGIGQVNNRTVMMVANDATVKGGTYFPLTVKKTFARPGNCIRK